MRSILFSCIVLLGLAVAQGFPSFFDFSASPGPISGRGLTDTGPVTFPPTPIGSETSGVIVGASGYGFVAPGQNVGSGRGFGGGYRGPSPSPYFYF